MSDPAPVPPIHLSFEVDRADSVRAARVRDARLGRLGRGPILFGCVVVAIGFFCYVNRAEMSRALAPVLLMLLGGYMAISPITRSYAAAERLWAETDRLRQPMTVEADDDGMRARTTLWTLDQKWAAFSDFAETRELFVLFYSPSQVGRIIPKRAFQSAGQVADFRRLLAASIHKPTGGFPVIGGKDGG